MDVELRSGVFNLGSQLADATTLVGSRPRRDVPWHECRMLACCEAAFASDVVNLAKIADPSESTADAGAFKLFRPFAYS